MSTALSSLSHSLIPHTRKIIASAHADHRLAIPQLLLLAIESRAQGQCASPVPVLVLRNYLSKDTRSSRRAFTKRANNKPRHTPTPTTKQETRQCHNCGKTGHLKRDCRAAKRPSNSSRSSSTRPSSTPSKWRRPQTARGAMQYPEVIYHIETAKAVRPAFYEHDDDCPLRAGICFTHCMCCNPAPTGPVINHGILYPISLPVPLPELDLAPPAISPPPLLRTNTIRPTTRTSGSSCCLLTRTLPHTSPSPPSPTFSELCASSPESVDSLNWAYQILAQEASPASANPSRRRQSHECLYPPHPSTTLRLAAQQFSRLHPSTTPTLARPLHYLWQQPSQSLSTCPRATLPSPSSTNIMLQLLGGPTVQPPGKRAPTVCNSDQQVQERRWQAWHQGQGGLEGSPPTQWDPLHHRQGVRVRARGGHLRPAIPPRRAGTGKLSSASPTCTISNHTAPSATDPSAKEKAHDNQAAQSVRDVLPSAGSPFLYLPALRTGQQEAEDLVSHLDESHGQFSRFHNGDMVALAITCGNYTVIRKLPSGRSWLPCAYTHGDSAESAAQRLLSDIGFPEVAQQLEKLGTHAVQDAEQGIVYMKCFGAKLKKIQTTSRPVPSAMV